MNTELNPTTGIRVDVLGPTIEFLTSPDAEGNDFCTLKGVIPPGVAVPLHSHADTEDFFVISGEVQGLRKSTEGYEWLSGKAGDYIHVPGNVPHAWRNVSNEPVVVLITTTPKMAHFFQEIGRPVTNPPQPPTPDVIANFLSVSDKYGYWNASPEENAAVGIHLQLP